MPLSHAERLDMQAAIIDASKAREKFRISNTGLGQAEIAALNAGLTEGRLITLMWTAKRLGIPEEDTHAFMLEGVQPAAEAASEPK